MAGNPPPGYRYTKKTHRLVKENYGGPRAGAGRASSLNNSSPGPSASVPSVSHATHTVHTVHASNAPVPIPATFFLPRTTNQPVPLISTSNSQTGAYPLLIVLNIRLICASVPMTSSTMLPGTISNNALTQLNAELAFIEENSEHGDIAAGLTQIDDSLVDEFHPDLDIDTSMAQSEAETPEPTVDSLIHQFLSAAKRRIVKEIEKYGQPLCYKRGSFFEYAMHPVFALKQNIVTGFTPNQLYHRDIFIWLPHLLPGHPDKFKCSCGQYLSRHGMLLNESKL